LATPAKLQIPWGPQLFIFAHPDDEYLAAGAIAAAVLAGHEVYVVSLTSGQAGLAKHWLHRLFLGFVRRRELRNACRALGAKQPIVMQYADGKLDRVDATSIARRLAILIRQTQPGCIWRLPPDGITLHPDHIVASEAAGIAHSVAAPAGCQLWEAVAGPAWARVDISEIIYERGRPISIGIGELAELELDGDLLALKQLVYLAHRSQHRSLRHLKPIEEAPETYRRVA
jgi:LmbE family N-acetylglucosaminyl deacetylase